MQTRCCSRMCICAADGFDPANQFPNYQVGLHSAWSPTSRRPEKRTPCTGTANRVSNQVALDYTGGQAGKADPKLSPVTIGLVNGEGGPVGFPDNTAGVKAEIGRA